MSDVTEVTNSFNIVEHARDMASAPQIQKLYGVTNTLSQLADALTEARAEIERLELDRKRLDWIEANSAWVLTTFDGEWGVWVEATKRCKRPQNLRYAIDAAIASSEGEKR